MVSATSAILVPLGSVPETRLIIFPKQCAVVYKLKDKKKHTMILPLVSSLASVSKGNGDHLVVDDLAVLRVRCVQVSLTRPVETTTLTRMRSSQTLEQCQTRTHSTLLPTTYLINSVRFL